MRKENGKKEEHITQWRACCLRRVKFFRVHDRKKSVHVLVIICVYVIYENKIR